MHLPIILKEVKDQFYERLKKVLGNNQPVMGGLSLRAGSWPKHLATGQCWPSNFVSLNRLQGVDGRVQGLDYPSFQQAFLSPSCDAKESARGKMVARSRERKNAKGGPRKTERISEKPSLHIPPGGVLLSSTLLSNLYRYVRR